MDPGALGERVVSCIASREGTQLSSRAVSSVLTLAMSKSHYNLMVFLVAGVGKSQF